jgi:hypothetical protein
MQRFRSPQWFFPFTDFEDDKRREIRHGWALTYPYRSATDFYRVDWTLPHSQSAIMIARRLENLQILN